MLNESSNTNATISATRIDEILEELVQALYQNPTHPEIIRTYSSLLKNVYNVNDDGLLPVLHLIREKRQRIPSQEYLCKRNLRTVLQPPSEVEVQDLKTLNGQGIVRVRGLFSDSLVASLQADHRTMVQDIKSKPPVKVDGDGFTEQYFAEDSSCYVTNNPFKHFKGLVEACVTPRLVNLINDYLGGIGQIHQGVAAALLPDARTGYGSFQWHHDAWGKRINIMILLTDVEEGDQYMTYLEGSHLNNYPHEKYVHSRMTAQDLDTYAPNANVFRATGKPGDVFVFDSNGLHSGNRTAGRQRDTIIVHYTRDPSYLWNLEIPQSSLADFTELQLAPMRRLLRANRERRSLVPKYRSWIEGLHDVAMWLPLEDSPFND